METKLLIVLFYVLSSGLFQEPLSKVAIVTVPEKSQKISKEEFSTFAKRKFKNSSGIHTNTKNIYKVDDVIVSFWDLSVDESYKRSLEQIKLEGLSLMTKSDIVDESSIKTINNSKILIFRYHKEDEYFYRFYTEDRKNKSISGVVQFKKLDIEKANSIFLKLVQSIKLKD